MTALENSNNATFQGETWDSVHLVAPGVHVIATEHNPGCTKYTPVVNNRCYLLEFIDPEDPNKEILVVYGPAGAGAVDLAKQVEEKLSKPIKYIVSQGGQHHLFLKLWLEEFPNATVLVPPARILSYTRNGQVLKEQFPGRIQELQDGRQSTPLFAQNSWDLWVMRGMLGSRDSKGPADGLKDGLWTFLTMLPDVFASEKEADECFCYLPQCKLLIVGDNVKWFYPEPGEPIPFILKQEGVVHNTVACEPVKIIPEYKTHVQQVWKEVLQCDFEVFTGFHEMPGVAVTENARKRLGYAARKVDLLDDETATLFADNQEKGKEAPVSCILL